MMKKLLILLLALAFNTHYSQNNYLDFDGTNDFVDVANSANILSGAQGISMSCKVFPKRVTFGFPDFDGFVGYRNESNFDFYIIQLSSTDVEARFRNSNGVAFSITYTGLVLNQWNQFFLIYNGTTLKLYSGAVEVGSVPASGTVPTTNFGNFRIGLITFQDYDWYHMGYIDEVTLFNKGIAASDIAAIVNNNGEIAVPSDQSNLKLYYKFNTGIPYGNNIGQTTAIDEMNLYPGTLNNFTLNGLASNWGGTVLSIADFNQDHIAVYPNPANNFIAITGLNAVSDVKIIDALGRIVLHQSIENEQSLDVSGMNSGMYIMTVNDLQKIRFIKK